MQKIGKDDLTKIQEEQLFKTFNEKEVFIAAALDSLGVPYTPDNILMKSYLEIIIDKFKEYGINVKYINLHNLVKNKSWHLLEYLDKNDSKLKIQRRHHDYAYLAFRKSRIMPFHYNPNFLNQYYQEIEDPEIKLLDMLSNTNQEVLFYLSCGGMDMGKYLKTEEIDNQSILKMGKEILLNFKKHINQTMLNHEECLDKIFSINSKIKVYDLSSYPALKERLLRRFFELGYKYYNKQLGSVAKKYSNANFVDIMMIKDFIAPNDLHPTYEGQKVIAKLLLKEMYNDRIMK